jgi:putative NIF3 family GTP cyclohydrolase 1 type 2
MNQKELSRREFAWLAGAGLLARGVAVSHPAAITAGEVVARIQKNVGIPWNPKTYRDTFKIGSPDVQVTGIVSTFMSTFDILQRSVKAGLNMIITHEPTFWSDADVVKDLGDDPLYRQKLDYALKNNLVVWRFHDHIHAMKPDGIFVGWNRALKWDKYQVGDDQHLFILPRTMSLEEVAREVKKNLQTDSMRVIGDPKLPVSKVVRGSHALAGNMSAVLEGDALLVLEAREFDSIEWMRDTVLSGQKKGMILIAHERGEQAGMDYCAQWLRTFITEVPVKFLSSNEPFWRPA